VSSDEYEHLLVAATIDGPMVALSLTSGRVTVHVGLDLRDLQTDDDSIEPLEVVEAALLAASTHWSLWVAEALEHGRTER
jgi:hypothetical protein